MDRVIPGMIEFDSMINIRPRQNNRSRGAEDAEIREESLGLLGTSCDRKGR